MGGGNKEHTLLDSIRNGDSQTAIKILQNSMLNKNQSFKSRLNQKFMPNKQQHYKQVDLTSSSLSSINTSRNRSLSVDCNFNSNNNDEFLNFNNTKAIRQRNLIELNKIQSTSNSNLTIKRRKHANNKLFDIKSLNTNNKLITKVFQYYDENNFNTLKSKLNLNYQDESGKSIIHEACISGSLELVKLIIESGSKLNTIDCKGYAPLHYACLNGKIDIVSALIQNGVDCNEPTLIGNETPLHLAIQHSDNLSVNLTEKIILIILTNGGHLSLCISNKNHQLTPFELACEAGLTQIVHTILKYCSQTKIQKQLQLITNFSLKSIHLAAKNGHDDIIRLLQIYNVCDINRVISLHDMNGSCLHEAARYGRTQTVKLLLESGVDTKIKNSMDQLALDVVIKQKTGNDIRCLIQEYSQSVIACSIKPYFSTRAGSLTFDQSELICVLERPKTDNNETLWRGFILNKLNFTTKYGYFPLSCVKVISDYDNPYSRDVQQSSPTSASLSSSSSSTISSPCSSSLINSYLNNKLTDSALNVTSLLRSGMNDSQIVFNWLKDFQLEQYYENFVLAGYDLLTIARSTTPADLCAIGVSNPLHRQILKQNMQRLNTKDLEDKLISLLNTVNTIEDLLKLVHLEQYLESINDLKFQSIEDFVNTVNWEDLEEIGFKLGHQKKLMHVLKCLKEILKKRDLCESPTVNSLHIIETVNLTKSLENLNAKICFNNLQTSKETAILNSPPKRAPEPPKRIDSIKINPPLPPRISSCIDKSLTSYATLPRNRKQNDTKKSPLCLTAFQSNEIESSFKIIKTSSPLATQTTNKIELKLTDRISSLNNTEPSVLNDIDNMLCDLNKQLDDMLDYEKFFD